MMNENKIFAPDLKDSQTVIDLYWENKSKPFYQYTILKELSELRSKDDADTRYLIKILENYPDSPGVLMMLADNFHTSHEYFAAYIVSKLLVFMYPEVTDFVKKNELIKILMNFQCTPGPEGCREFGEAIDKWTEGVNL